MSHLCIRIKCFQITRCSPARRTKRRDEKIFTEIDQHSSASGAATCSTHSFLHFFSATLLTPVFLATNCMGVSSQPYQCPAFGAVRWFVSRWVLKFLEVEFICSVVDVYFSLKAVSAFRAILPASRMFFRVMIATQRVAAVVSRTTIGGIRKRDIVVLIVAYPLPATLRLYQILCLSAQSAFGFPFTRLLLFHKSSFLSLNIVIAGATEAVREEN